jgi:predicted NBD/HSP70 family sugar kinase
VFVDWFAAQFRRDETDAVIIALPGSVDATGRRLAYNFNPSWNYDVDLADLLSPVTEAGIVRLINDVEAHALAGQENEAPLLCLALGSSIGAAVLDVDGRFVRTSVAALDLGGFKVPTL